MLWKNIMIYTKVNYWYSIYNIKTILNQYRIPTFIDLTLCCCRVLTPHSMMYVGLYYTYLHISIDTYIGCWYIKCIIIKKYTIPHTKKTSLSIHQYIFIVLLYLPTKTNFYPKSLLLKNRYGTTPNRDIAILVSQKKT